MPTSKTKAVLGGGLKDVHHRRDTSGSWTEHATCTVLNLHTSFKWDMAKQCQGGPGWTNAPSVNTILLRWLNTWEGFGLVGAFQWRWPQTPAERQQQRGEGRNSEAATS